MDTIVLSPMPLVAHVSDYVFITATVYDRNHQRVESPGLKWSVDDASLAYISIGGDTLADLWGKAVGTTALSATFGGKTTRLQLQVQPVVVTKMTVAPGVAAVEKGSQRQLQLFELNPHGMAVANPTASWSSSDVNLATVDQNGIVTAIKEGTVEIRAAFDTLQASVTLHVPTPFASVTAGDTHACGLKTDGRVFCWGGNSQGQLGDGTLTTQFAPVEVKTNARFASIYALFAASCGLTSAGDLFCWGSNANGWLGIPGASPVLTPTVVPAPEPFSQVATGGGHICAIGMSGTTYCWGSGSATGRLGASGATPVAAPAPVQTPVPFTAVVAGDQYSCGLGTDKRAYCWGVDFMGQLGDSVPDRTFVEGRATVAPVAGGHVFTALFAGPLADNTCALAVDGTSWCWGDYVESNAASTTADCLVPSSRCSPVPVLVSSTVQFTSMTTGLRSQCALDSTGQAFCWGNGFDRRGSSFLPVPAKLETALRFTSISAGRSHQCGISLSSAIFCWGNNEAGKIGDYSAVPTPGATYGASIVISPALIAAP